MFRQRVIQPAVDPILEPAQADRTVRCLRAAHSHRQLQIRLELLRDRLGDDSSADQKAVQTRVIAAHSRVPDVDAGVELRIVKEIDVAADCGAVERALGRRHHPETQTCRSQPSSS